MMKKLLSLNLFVLFFSCAAYGQLPFNWVNTADGGTGISESLDVTVDKFGNVYTTGGFQGTVDFDPGSALDTHSTGLGQLNSYIIKHDNNGNFIWAKTIGFQGACTAAKIVTDSSGNIYIAGYFNNTVDLDPGTGVDNHTSAGTFDIFFAKYDSSGNHIWGRSMGSTMTENCTQMCIDNAGYIYLAGHFPGPMDFDPGTGTQMLSNTGGADAFIAKYDGNGNYVNAVNMGSTDMWPSMLLTGLGVDPSSNIYIIGTMRDSVDADPGTGVAMLRATTGSSYDVFFAKYDSAMDYQWANVLNGGIAQFQEKAVAIRGNAAGEVYICGKFSGTLDFDPGSGTANLVESGGLDLFFAHYNANGAYIYAKALGNTGMEEVSDIAIDDTGNVYLTGKFNGTMDLDPDAGVHNVTAPVAGAGFLAKYGPAGQFKYAITYGDVNGGAGIHCVTLDAVGNRYIAGGYSNTLDFDPGTSSVIRTTASVDYYVAKFGNVPISTTTRQLSKEGAVFIYPNPARESVKIRSGSNILAVRLSDITGKCLLSTKGDEVYLGDRSPGMYLIQVQTDNGNFIEKIIKE